MPKYNIVKKIHENNKIKFRDQTYKDKTDSYQYYFGHGALSSRSFTVRNL